MKVTLLRDLPYSPDRCKVIYGAAGETIDVPAWLAESLVRGGDATPDNAPLGTGVGPDETQNASPDETKGDDSDADDVQDAQDVALSVGDEFDDSDGNGGVITRRCTGHDDEGNAILEVVTADADAIPQDLRNLTDLIHVGPVSEKALIDAGLCLADIAEGSDVVRDFLISLNGINEANADEIIADARG